MFNPSNLIGIETTPEHYLGVRVAYSIKNVSVPWQWLAEQLMTLGFAKYAPKAPAAADVFRRVTGQIKATYQLEKHIFKVNVFPVSETGDPVERAVQVTEIDPEGREISDGRTVARLYFYRSSNIFDCRIERDCPVLVAERIQEAQNRFGNETNYLSPEQLRYIVMAILLDSGNQIQGIAGLWNIPRTRQDNTYKLRDLFNAINSLGSEPVCFIDILPIVDVVEQREKVKTDAVYSAAQRFRALLEEMKERVCSSREPEKVMENCMARIQQESREIMALISEYKEILGHGFKEVEAIQASILKEFTEFANSPLLQSEYKQNSGRRLKKTGSAKVIQPAVETPVTIRRLAK